MKKNIIIGLNLIINAGAGFYIFSSAFNDSTFDLFNAAFISLCVGIVLGIISGASLKTTKPAEILFSIAPLLAFFSLFVLGSIENGGIKEMIAATLIFLSPLLFEGGSWFFSARLSKRV